MAGHKDFHSLVAEHGRNIGTRTYLSHLQWPNVHLVYRIETDPDFGEHPHANAVAMADTAQGKLVLSVWDSNAVIHFYNEEPNDSAQWEVHHADDPLFGLFHLVCQFLEKSDEAHYTTRRYK